MRGLKYPPSAQAFNTVVPINFLLIPNTDIHPYQECGGTFSNETGIITSPFHPNPYPNNAECDYLILQPNGTCVNVTVEAFHIDAVGNCLADFLEIRDGMDSDSPLLGKFCGSNIGPDIPNSIQSTHQNLRISFRSNYFINGHGFALKYETGNCGEDLYNVGTCGGYFTSQNGFIASPSYPYTPYPNDANCIYIVSQPNGTRINITITDMDIEYTSDYYDDYYDYHQFGGITCFDYLEFRDGNSESSELLGKYCGDSDVLSLPFSLQSTQEYVWIR